MFLKFYSVNDDKLININLVEKWVLKSMIPLKDLKLFLRIGSVSRTIIGHSTCPVLIIEIDKN